MRWEIIDNTPKVGDVRFKTRFAFFPTKVLSKLTMTDHIIWLELYIEEQEYKRIVAFDMPAAFEDCWVTVAKTIHI
jgi:archaellum component FlaD/FlaE